MTNSNLSHFIDKFLALKDELIKANKKLSEHDAALLASRLLELPQGIPSSLYFEVKQSSRFVPYRFLGTRLTIKKISVTQRNDVNALKLEMTLSRGIRVIPINLSSTNAALFYSLLTAKFVDFEKDAEGGLSSKREFSDESECARIVTQPLGRLKMENPMFSPDDFRNLKRPFVESEYSDIIERDDNKARLSIPPHHIGFEPKAREAFEQMTGSVLDGFESRYNTRIFTAE